MMVVIIISPSVIICSFPSIIIITLAHSFRFLCCIHRHPWLLSRAFYPFLSHNTRHLRPRGWPVEPHPETLPREAVLLHSSRTDSHSLLFRCVLNFFF